MTRLSKLKITVSLLFFVTSCVTLILAPSQIAWALDAYGAGFPASNGPHLPAFTAWALRVMPHAATICFSTLAVTLALLMLVLRKVRERDARLYWIGLLANLNFYAVVWLFGVVLVGFFALPKIANGA